MRRHCDHYSTLQRSVTEGIEKPHTRLHCKSLAGDRVGGRTIHRKREAGERSARTRMHYLKDARNGDHTLTREDQRVVAASLLDVEQIKVDCTIARSLGRVAEQMARRIHQICRHRQQFHHRVPVSISQCEPRPRRHGFPGNQDSI